MSESHRKFWPDGVPHQLTVPATHLFYNAEVSAARYPDKPFLVFFDNYITFGEFKRQAEALAGYLKHECGIRKGDRVLLYMQNSPQFVIAYYAILRANAVVVPVNPMSLSAELEHYVTDSGSKIAIVAQELFAQISPSIRQRAEAGLTHCVVCTYSDYLKDADYPHAPEAFTAPRQPVSGTGTVQWQHALDKNLHPGALDVGPDDLCVIPYTSGTTGRPKGCMHTHRSVMTTLVGMETWFSVKPDDVRLSTLPFFHVTGMQGGMNSPLYTGSTVVLLPRWDRASAARYIERYGVASWTATPTMVIDLLSHPDLDTYDFSSLQRINSGGAAMPEAVAQKLRDRKITIIEGYGLTETIAPTHLNPPLREKLQCLGIPIFQVDSRIVDPQTLEELPAGEVGEIVTHAPQVFAGYWRDAGGSSSCFVEIEGKRFFRTGDLARTDEDGYFFMVDRVKRMINAAGYKVWPAEVESYLYNHPAVKEVCVVASPDVRRGETVKAFVVLRPQNSTETTRDDLITWARSNMSSYKVPRIVELVQSLPKTGSGKVDWRALQDQEFSTSRESTARP